MIPKFRAWEISGKRMISVKSIDFVNRFIEYIHRPYSNPNRILSEILEFENIILMQSTGLFDSQPEPVEIYKDDIVEYRWPYDRRLKALGVIVWREDRACFAIRNINGLGTEEVELYRLTASKYLKVLSNIHEHPELVEVE